MRKFLMQVHHEQYIHPYANSSPIHPDLIHPCLKFPTQVQCEKYIHL
jgi:hypothetical protein